MSGQASAGADGSMYSASSEYECQSSDDGEEGESPAPEEQHYLQASHLTCVILGTNIATDTAAAPGCSTALRALDIALRMPCFARCASSAALSHEMKQPPPCMSCK